MTYKFEALRDEYAALWAAARVRPENESEVRATARKIIANRPRYDTVSRRTGVPWYVIGIMHNMECSLSFAKHLHNGDPLKTKTKNVPKGRPLVWPADGEDAWEASAVDALTMKGKEFHKITDWSVERIGYVLETFNGFGYRQYRKIHSPYLWSMTTNYKAGKYVSDGVWSAVAISGQCGGMAILKALIELDPNQIDLDDPKDETPAWPKVEVSGKGAVTPTVVAKEVVTSRTNWALLTGGFAWIGQQLERVYGIIPGVQGDVEQQLGVMTSMQKMLKVNFFEITTGFVLVLLAIAIFRHTRDKLALSAATENE